MQSVQRTVDADDEADAVRRARRARDARLSPAERLERLHWLCRRLAEVKASARPPR